MGELSKQLQIYIVEDSPIMLRLLTSSIEASGAKLAGHSENAQRAIDEISVLHPDLVLIDIGLNQGNGFDVLRLLQHRDLAQSAKKVVLTNHANAEYRDLSFRLGANQFYDKSCEMLKVLELIKVMAAGHVTSMRAPASGDPESHGRP